MFASFWHLVSSRGLNGCVELKDIKLTSWQLEGLKDYIKNTENVNCVYDTVSEYNLIIVENITQSDLTLK